MINNLSICIPTYNRSKYLSKLYKSLIKQDGKNLIDIQLVIVDDGSTDDTKDLVSKWIQDNNLSIKYYYQSNKGRAHALKKAIEIAENDYSIIVDDDCYFLPDFLYKIQKFNNKNIYNTNIAGICYLREDIKGNLKGNKFSKNYLITDLVTIRQKYKKKGEISEITKTNILKNNLYPSFEGEKRISTDCLWLSISEDYKYIFINETIRVSEYADDGLSKNLRLYKILSPKSSFYYEISVLKNSKTNYLRKYLSILKSTRWFFSIKANERFKMIRTVPYRYCVQFTLFLIIGFVIYLTDLLFRLKTNQKIR